MAMNGNCGVLKYCSLLACVLLLVTNIAHAYKDQMNEGLDVGIPGLHFVGTWTFQGVGSVRLEYESGYVCYKASGRCYDYDASLSFRQVGTSFYGRKIYIDTFYGGKGSVWLDGFTDGGVKVYVESYLLPLDNVENNIYFNHSPSYWNGDDDA